MEQVSFLSSFFGVICLGVIAYIVWQVVSSLNRTIKAVEEIAATLRRMESRDQTPAPHA